MTQRTSTAGEPSPPSFSPVPVRARHDGWTAARQIALIQALAATACVEEACRRVGMSSQGAYELRARPDAVSFRQAWDVALDFAVGRVADAALGRALNGVVIPVFYKGEQIGEKRVFNDRLTMFILRHRAPERYGAWRDDVEVRRDDPDGAAVFLGEAIRRVAEDGAADAAGRPRPARGAFKTERMHDDPDEIAAQERREDARRKAALEAQLAAIEAEGDEDEDEKPGDATANEAGHRSRDDFAGDVLSRSSTFAGDTPDRGVTRTPPMPSIRSIGGVGGGSGP